MAGREDQEREDRIVMEIVVDAYGPEERAMSWFYYLQDNLGFPFSAVCTSKRPINLLNIGDKVKVTGMTTEADCEHDIFVMVRWQKKALAVPLAQLKPDDNVDPATEQAFEDWLYWVEQGYEF